MTLARTRSQFARQGKVLTPLEGKVPVLAKWTTRVPSDAMLDRHSGNLGWVLGGHDLVIDADPRNGGRRSFRQLEQDLSVVFRRSVSTASGGWHVYLWTLEDSGDFRKSLSAYPGLDFLGRGQQCVVPGSSIPGVGDYEWYDEGRQELVQENAPQALLEMLSKPAAHRKREPKGSDLPEERVMECLAALDPACGYDDWIRIGMALHDWSERKGLRIWDEWSKQDKDSWEDGACREKWATFSNPLDRGAVKAGTLVFMAAEAAQAAHKNWHQKWIYVASHTAFLEQSSGQLHKSESFNMSCGRYVPMGKSGVKMSATKYAADRGLLRVVDSIGYFPSVSSRICSIDGKDLWNSYTSASLPECAEQHTARGMRYIELLESHAMLLTGSEAAAEILLSWMAHQVQRTGDKVLWAPVLQSVPGGGKSFLAHVLRAALGDSNVGIVSPSQAISQFNSWAVGHAVNVLEELRISGHSRYEATNALKPLITDKMVQINRKGTPQYMAYNTCNYICFTNFRDAIPAEDHDRRWWIIWAPFESMEGLRRAVGMPPQDYFQMLFSGLERHHSEIRKWLLERPLSKLFKPRERAPDTSHKRSVQATEESGIEGLAEAREMICAGGRWYCEAAVSSSDLWLDLMAANPRLELSSHAKSGLLKRLGYMAHPARVRAGGRQKRFWTRMPMVSDEIADLFTDNGLPR